MTDRPRRFDHVVLISLDTLRADGIAANPLRLWESKYGPIAPRPRTDAIDDLVREGCLFANAITAAPYTSASHATYLTGEWPLRHGVYEFFNRRLTSRTVFARARAAGYRTVLKSDFPLILGPHLGFTDDVDEFIVEGDEEVLSRLDPSRPSFSLIHFGGLHIPYGFHNLRYGKDDYARTVEALERGMDAREGFIGDRLVETYRDPADLAMLLRYKREIQRRYEDGRYAEIFALYLGGIEYFMRTRFSPFLSALRARFAGTNTLYVLFGDHGEEYDENSYGHFNSLAEGVLRVPVVFFGDGVARGIHTSRIRTVDVGTTIQSLVFGHEATNGLDGVDLSRTVEAGDPYAVHEAFAQAYTSDTDAFVAFQTQMLATGRKPGQLRHVCYAESAYLGPFKLTRQRFKYLEDAGRWRLHACEPILTLELFGQDGVPAPVENPSMTDALTAILERLGSIPSRPSAALAIPESVRADLEDFGYAV